MNEGHVHRFDAADRCSVCQTHRDDVHEHEWTPFDIIEACPDTREPLPEWVPEALRIGFATPDFIANHMSNNDLYTGNTDVLWNTQTTVGIVCRSCGHVLFAKDAEITVANVTFVRKGGPPK